MMNTRHNRKKKVNNIIASKSRDVFNNCNEASLINTVKSSKSKYNPNISQDSREEIIG